jgi:hypothetical protein
MQNRNKRFMGLGLFLGVVLMSLVQSVGLVSRADAQTVAVQNGRENGHGWMFAEGDACYLILPRHLADPVGRMRLRTAAPVAEGTAFGRLPFWPGIDLAVATVDLSLRPRCTGQLDDLDLPGALRDARAAQLERLSGAGEIERVPLVIGSRTYLTFRGMVPDGARVAEGTSGAFAFVGDRPVGMAFTADGDRRAEFIRAGEIRIHVARWLEEHGRPFSSARTYPQTDDEDGATSDLPIRFVSSSVDPIDPGFTGENLTQPEGIFVAEPQGGVSLLFRVGEGDAAAPLAQVILEAPPDAGFEVPREVLIQFSAQPDGSSMRNFDRGEMQLDGSFATRLRQPLNARWIKVRILSAWGRGPVALGRIRAR